MGFALAWVAVRGMSRAEVLKTLGVAGTGRFDEVPEAPLCGAALPTGWYVVVAERMGALEVEVAGRLSRGGESVACWIEEHMMFSMACGFSKGKERWSVTHDPEEGVMSLETSGRLPPAFAAIRDELLGKQRPHGRIDYVFGVPIDLCASLTGFRHDHDIEGADERPFELLEPAPAVRRSRARPRGR
jgi:hypothetical protein